ncbi:hypothetical protein NQD34_009867 [Periophthalmus magnuspinnatus]|nr:hypothetical protein NQD34_009867 [Periophthalmus magnuspinnatus]
MPLDVETLMKDCSEELPPDSIAAVVQAIENQKHTPATWTLSAAAMSVVVQQGESAEASLAPIPKEQLSRVQKTDPVISPVLQCKQTDSKPLARELKTFNPKIKCLFREWDKLVLDTDGILYRTTSVRKQLVLPEQFKKTVLEELHNNMGHQGVDRTVSLVRDRFFWPYMQADIEHYVTKVCSCVKQKKPNRETRAPLTNIVTTQPFELVCIDFLHLDKCKGGYEYILVIVDHFTRFAQAYATTSKSGKTAANLIFNDYALKFGFPCRIHHDQGGEFENQLFLQLKKLSGMAGSRTTPYHPMGNGQVERMNRTLLQMLKTLTETQKSNWKDSINKLMYSYNCTRCEVTGYSPFYLLFGRSPRLPVDMLFGLHSDSSSSDYRGYVDKWRRGMEEAYAIASENAKRDKPTLDVQVSDDDEESGNEYSCYYAPPQLVAPQVPDHSAETGQEPAIGRQQTPVPVPALPPEPPGVEKLDAHDPAAEETTREEMVSAAGDPPAPLTRLLHLQDPRSQGPSALNESDTHRDG